MGAAFLVFGKRTDLASLIKDQNNEQFGLLLKMDVQEWLFNDWIFDHSKKEKVPFIIFSRGIFKNGTESKNPNKWSKI